MLLMPSAATCSKAGYEQFSLVKNHWQIPGLDRPPLFNQRLCNPAFALTGGSESRCPSLCKLRWKQKWYACFDSLVFISSTFRRITRATNCGHSSSGRFHFHFDILCFSRNEGIYPSNGIVWSYWWIASFGWEWRNTAASWANRPCLCRNRPTSLARLDDARRWMSEEWVLLCTACSCAEDRWGNKPEKGP